MTSSLVDAPSPKASVEVQDKKQDKPKSGQDKVDNTFSSSDSSA